ncbi:MAG: ribosomal protein S18-alanine N-acetyltransferase, partial [Polyangiaceae bacterium]
EAVIEIDREAFARGGTTSAIDVREEAARPWSRIFVAREKDVPVAYLVAWHVADELHLLAIATAVHRRRAGIGRALVQRLVDFAFERDVLHIFLEVRRSNEAAIALYRSFGFYLLGLRAKYYTDGEDALEMAIALDPQQKRVLARDDEEL